MDAGACLWYHPFGFGPGAVLVDNRILSRSGLQSGDNGFATIGNHWIEQFPGMPVEPILRGGLHVLKHIGMTSELHCIRSGETRMEFVRGGGLQNGAKFRLTNEVFRGYPFRGAVGPRPVETRIVTDLVTHHSFEAPLGQGPLKLGLGQLIVALVLLFRGAVGPRPVETFHCEFCITTILFRGAVGPRPVETTGGDGGGVTTTGFRGAVRLRPVGIRGGQGTGAFGVRRYLRRRSRASSASQTSRSVAASRGSPAWRSRKP